MSEKKLLPQAGHLLPAWGQYQAAGKFAPHKEREKDINQVLQGKKAVPSTGKML